MRVGQSPNRPIHSPPHPQAPFGPAHSPRLSLGLSPSSPALSCALLWQLRFSSSILAAADRNGLAGWRSLALPCVDVGSLQKLLPSDHDDALVHELVRKQDLHSRPVPWPPLSPSRRYAAALTRRYRVESWFRRMKCFLWSMPTRRRHRLPMVPHAAAAWTAPGDIAER